MKVPDSPTATGTASLEKCLTIFNRIAADRGRTALADLAGDLQLPRSTLYRLTGVLERSGLIARIQPGHFSIGLPFMETLQGLTAHRQIAEVARPLLQRLASACRATAHLGVMENDMVTYLVKVSAGTPDAVAPFTQENAQLEAYCSGIGKVLLAWLPQAEQEKYLAGAPFVALTQQTITDPETLRVHLATVRAKKYAEDNQEVAQNLYCLAVPLWTSSQPMRAAISLSFTQGSAQRRSASANLQHLRSCATKISRKLGKT